MSRPRSQSNDYDDGVTDGDAGGYTDSSYLLARSASQILERAVSARSTGDRSVRLPNPMSLLANPATRPVTADTGYQPTGHLNAGLSMDNLMAPGSTYSLRRGGQQARPDRSGMTQPEEIGDLLQDRKASLQRGLTALHVAAGMDDELTVQQLIDRNPDDVMRMCVTADKLGRTPLIFAVLSDAVGITNMLLQLGAQVNACDGDSRTAGHWAAYHGRAHILQLLLEYGLQVELQDKDGRTAIHWAAIHEDPTCLHLLLTSSAEAVEAVNVGDAEGMTPLHWAAYHERPDNVSLLLEAGADPSVVDVESKTALHWVAANKSPDGFDLLIQVMPDLINARDGQGLSPLHSAIAEHNVYLASRMLQLVVQDDSVPGGQARICDPDMHDAAGRTPLHWAAATDDVDAMDLLFSAGASPDTQDANGATALHYCVQRNSLRCIESFVGHGGNVNLADMQQCTPLMWAVMQGSQDAVAALLDCGADPTIQDAQGRNCLHLATAADSAVVLEMLLQIPACHQAVNVKDEASQSPLLLVAASGSVDMLELLLAAGADVNAADEEGKRPLHHAAIGKHELVALRLVQSGADVDALDSANKSPLHYAAFAGSEETITVLVAQGADVNLPDTDGVTPLHWAALQGNASAVHRLLQYNANVNAMESNGDHMTPLDYANIHGHTQCVDILANSGGLSVEDFRHFAALAIQAAFRGWKARKYVQGLRKDRMAEIARKVIEQTKIMREHDSSETIAVQERQDQHRRSTFSQLPPEAGSAAADASQEAEAPGLGETFTAASISADEAQGTAQAAPAPPQAESERDVDEDHAKGKVMRRRRSWRKSSGDLVGGLRSLLRRSRKSSTEEEIAIEADESDRNQGAGLSTQEEQSSQPDSQAPVQIVEPSQQSAVALDSNVTSQTLGSVHFDADINQHNTYGSFDGLGAVLTLADLESGKEHQKPPSSESLAYSSEQIQGDVSNDGGAKAQPNGLPPPPFRSAGNVASGAGVQPAANAPEQKQRRISSQQLVAARRQSSSDQSEQADKARKRQDVAAATSTRRVSKLSDLLEGSKAGPMKSVLEQYNSRLNRNASERERLRRLRMARPNVSDERDDAATSESSVSLPPNFGRVPADRHSRRRPGRTERRTAISGVALRYGALFRDVEGNPYCDSQGAPYSDTQLQIAALVIQRAWLQHQTRRVERQGRMNRRRRSSIEQVRSALRKSRRTSADALYLQSPSSQSRTKPQGSTRRAKSDLDPLALAYLTEDASSQPRQYKAKPQAPLHHHLKQYHTSAAVKSFNSAVERFGQAHADIARQRSQRRQLLSKSANASTRASRATLQSTNARSRRANSASVGDNRSAASMASSIRTRNDSAHNKGANARRLSTRSDHPSGAWQNTPSPPLSPTQTRLDALPEDDDARSDDVEFDSSVSSTRTASRQMLSRDSSRSEPRIRAGPRRRANQAHDDKLTRIIRESTDEPGAALLRSIPDRGDPSFSRRPTRRQSTSGTGTSTAALGMPRRRSSSSMAS